MSIGLDVGGTKALGVVLDLNGRVLARRRVATKQGPDGVVRSALEVVDGLRSACGLGHHHHTLGVGIPGLVDYHEGAVRHAVNLGLGPEWFPLGRLLADKLGVSVVVENDVNAAAVGAQWLAGANGPVNDLVYLSLGTGLAAGMVFDGELRRGDQAAAGEIGHISIDPNGPVCPCGQRGCLELVASGSALARSWPTKRGHPGEALFDAAAAGDARAVVVRDRFAAGVANAVRIVALAVDPPMVILGGGVAELGDQLRIAVATALVDQAASSPFLAGLDLAARLRVAPPDTAAAALGAARLGMTHR